MLGKPQIERLKQIGEGLEVDRVCGDRLLVELVEAETEMDRATQRSGLVIPEHIQKSYKPESSTGVIVEIGSEARGFAVGEMVLFN